MATLENKGDGIVTLSASDSHTFSSGEKVTDIIVAGTAAGSFVMVIGETAMTIVTGSANPTRVIPINRHLNYVELTSGPTAAKAYVMLEKK